VSVLVATSDGCHVFTGTGTSFTALDGRAVRAFAASPDGTWFAIVDGRELWAHAPGDGWRVRATWDAGLSTVHVHHGTPYVGTRDARLVRLVGDTLEPVEAFDRVPGRAEWHSVGAPLSIRSMTSTSDGTALLASVHVGGIPRSTDDGASWAPTLPVHDDVHEVRAHPDDPSLVVAAAAVGLGRSDDGGATWVVETDGLVHTYARAVAFTDVDILVSVAAGPHARRSTICARPINGGRFTRVEHGLPDDGLQGIVDTACLAGQGLDVALADGAGDVWGRHGDGAWVRVAAAVGEVSAVAIT